ncbi:hypothetical protein FGE12_11855 [Aggregicoccus sp. 17bor-14]|uniref:hypothetical protein n=1 Tax=Myxococcaceae TaxID=31 RepID=UPI00129C30BC|nr:MULTISPECIES: hypothetical protein [Myxococcaceae]MBF5043083.1 hypothetical protein [Simulacricoccus sp. 17bor-14]MRI88846.1 hypothetical protein [Aggregicoccus sp. 17bor-14]
MRARGLPLLSLLALTACSRGASAPDAGAKSEKLRWVDPANTMAEVSGKLEQPMAAARRVAFISATPCAEALTAPSLISQVEVEAPPQADFYLKFWQARGTQGYVCAVAFDAKNDAVGLASAEGPPLHFGEDHLVRENLRLTLAPVAPGTRVPQLLVDTAH